MCLLKDSRSSLSASIDTRSTEASHASRRPRAEETREAAKGLNELRAVHARCTRRWRQHSRSPSGVSCQKPRHGCVSEADQVCAPTEAQAELEIDPEHSTEGQLLQVFEPLESSRAEVDRLLGEKAVLRAKLLEMETPRVQSAEPIKPEDGEELRIRLPCGVGITLAAATCSCVIAASLLRAVRANR